MNFNLSFLNKLKNKEKNILDILQSENNFYRGAIPWFLLCSEKKKIIYISTSNRNLENYYSIKILEIMEVKMRERQMH